jgi:hypothetical protein
MKKTFVDSIREEWDGMTKHHKIRLILGVNAMIFLSITFINNVAFKMLSLLLGYHYGITVLYANNTTMSTILNKMWLNGMLYSSLYDLMIYLICMIVLAVFSYKKNILGDDKSG